MRPIDFVCYCGGFRAVCPALILDGRIIAQAAACQKGFNVSLEEMILYFVVGALAGWAAAGLEMWLWQQAKAAILRWMALREERALAAAVARREAELRLARKEARSNPKLEGYLPHDDA